MIIGDILRPSAGERFGALAFVGECAVVELFGEIGFKGGDRAVDVGRVRRRLVPGELLGREIQFVQRVLKAFAIDGAVVILAEKILESAAVDGQHQDADQADGQQNQHQPAESEP